MSAAIMATVKIGVGRFRNKTETIRLKEFRQILGAVALEVERRLLRVFLGRWPVSKLSGAPNGFIRCVEVVIQQPAGRD